MNNKQKTIELDEYEQEILDAFENRELKPVRSKTDFQAIARNTMRKNRKINIRISENDLSALQRRAARDGIPYQTLIGSVLHKFASGFMKEAISV
jgi:predicted DNA binding CopG/RHH family protein